MCEYCEENKKIKLSLTDSSRTNISNNYILLQINYCIMCGRKLGEEK